MVPGYNHAMNVEGLRQELAEAGVHVANGRRIVQEQRERIERLGASTRPKGRPEGERIDDDVVEDHADHVLASFKTQHQAIEWARNNGHGPLVARVRHLNDKKRPDHWRSA